VNFTPTQSFFFAGQAGQEGRKGEEKSKKINQKPGTENPSEICSFVAFHGAG
jgi:hypothetical protein